MSLTVLQQPLSHASAKSASERVLAFALQLTSFPKDCPPRIQNSLHDCCVEFWYPAGQIRPVGTSHASEGDVILHSQRAARQQIILGTGRDNMYLSYSCQLLGTVMDVVREVLLWPILHHRWKGQQTLEYLGVDTASHQILARSLYPLLRWTCRNGGPLPARRITICAHPSSAASTGRQASARSRETSRPTCLQRVTTSSLDTLVWLGMRFSAGSDQVHIRSWARRCAYSDLSNKGTDMPPAVYSEAGGNRTFQLSMLVENVSSGQRC